MNTITFQQVFYGHNGTGYGILASSDPSLNAVVESFCQQIGTPSDRDSGPILLSIPHGNPFPIRREPENVPVSTSSKSETSEKNAPSWLRKAFAVSLLLNLLFAGGLWLGQESKPSTVSAPPDMEKLKEEMRTQVLDELRKAFPEECVINDWEDFKEKNNLFFGRDGDKEIKYLDKYIEMVNVHILRKDEK